MALRKRRPGLVYPTWEDWHYVGSGGGEPAFGTDWSNSGSPWPAMAFRLREAAVVDLYGLVVAGATAAASSIFTLPVAYRPTHQAFMPMIRQRSSSKSGQLLVVNDTGNVEPTDSSDPGDYIYIAGSFSLLPPAP